MFDIYRAAREAIALGDLGAGKPAAEDIDAVEIPPGLGLLAHAVVRTFQTEWMSEILRASVEAQDERQRLEAERRAADPA